MLDTTKDGILDSIMLNHSLLDEKSKKIIINEWEKISHKQVPSILNQLHDKDWLNYNRIVLQQFGLEDVLPELVSTFESAVRLRAQVSKITTKWVTKEGVDNE
ncbi:hypothetical protein EEI45_00705 [Erysipelothrix piscisicarius]|uniref:Uncharacterized protein n=1 Tax=Erysipelothrix piscisicarius TaxID=2485784 RepID=A0A3Q8S6H4_9FIRM|nr:hypothetical protein [Erysipelothrix piscisicarius]AZK43523.1 hypothetical protein EEI45_00705 [Erysipelothrix piscisicarius]